MKSIPAHSLQQALQAGEAVFDTRPMSQYQANRLEGVKHLSLEQVQAGHLPDVAKHQPLYLLCERGHISALVGLYLENAGFEQVYNLAGGLIAWRAAFP